MMLAADAEATDATDACPDASCEAAAASRASAASLTSIGAAVEAITVARAASTCHAGRRRCGERALAHGEGGAGAAHS